MRLEADRHQLCVVVSSLDYPELGEKVSLVRSIVVSKSYTGIIFLGDDDGGDLGRGDHLDQIVLHHPTDIVPAATCVSRLGLELQLVSAFGDKVVLVVDWGEGHTLCEIVCVAVVSFDSPARVLLKDVGVTFVVKLDNPVLVPPELSRVQA